MSRVQFRWFGDSVKRWARRKGVASLDAAGKAGVEYARAIVPVDTGQLKDSIGYTVVQSTMTATLYADKEYALFVELTQPFIRPALQHMGTILVSPGRAVGAFPGTDERYGGPQTI